MTARISLSLLIVSFLFVPGGVQAETLEVGAGQAFTTIQAALGQAEAGDRIVVKGGLTQGPLLVDKSVKLVGEGRPVIDGGGRGTAVRLAAPGIEFRGFKVRNSGDRLANEDSGLTAEAPRCLIEDNIFEDVLFGVYLRRSPESVVRKNILGGKRLDIARRGDLIRVWYSDGALVEGNQTTGGRDAVLWFSKDTRVLGNEFVGGRYGLHFMYCRGALVERNRLLKNSVGAYLMYSAGLELRGNLISGNRGPSGFGVGFKDMEGALIEQNAVTDNRVGLFMDNASGGVCRENLVATNDVGFQIFPTVRSNRFERNNVIDNSEQAVLDARSVYTVNDWTGNYWSDYRGFDADRDGVGDVPHRPMKLFERLTDRTHALKIFLWSPAVSAVDFAASVFPVFQPVPKFSDERPLMSAVRLSVPGAVPAAPAFWLGTSVLLFAPVFILFAALRRFAP